MQSLYASAKNFKKSQFCHLRSRPAVPAAMLSVTIIPTCRLSLFSRVVDKLLGYMSVYMWQNRRRGQSLVTHCKDVDASCRTPTPYSP